MSAVTVAANRYAKALFAVAKEKNEIEAVGEQLDGLAEAMNEAAIRAFFEHPNVGVGAKIQALQSALGGKVSASVENAGRLLVERGRILAIREVATAYRKIADEALARAKAHVTSAYPLSPEQEREIAAKFGALTGKQVHVESVVDSSLLGGVRVRIGDMLYDGSLATRLTELEKSLI